MKNLFTLCIMLAALFATAQSTEFRPAKQYNRVPGAHAPNRYRHQNHSASRATGTCDTIFLDYNTYNEVWANEQTFNFTGSWNSSSPSILAAEVTPFVDADHEFDYKYVMAVFDSIVDSDIGSATLLPSTPLASSVISLDSMGMFIGLSGDTTNSPTGKMAHDSLVFTVYKLASNTLTPVKTVVFSGYDGLAPFLTGPQYLGYVQVGLGYTFNKGEGFAVRMDYLAKDTSSHLLLSYTYADSCGSIDYQGQTFSSPAYPSPFIINSYFGEISVNGATASVVDENNGYGYNIPGVPANCTFVYTQNFEFLPIISVCTDYSTVITPSTVQSCPNSEVTLEANTYGTNTESDLIDYTWTSVGGTLTSTSGANTSVVMDSTGSATIIVAANDGNATTYDTVVIKNNPIGIHFTTAGPVEIACGSSVNLVTSISGITTGKHYYWSNGVNGTNKASISTDSVATYVVTVTNTYGCSASASIVVQYNSGVNNAIDFTPPTSVCANSPAHFVATASRSQGWSFTWNMGDGHLATGQDTFYTYQNPGLWQVRVQADSAGCSFSSPTRTVSVGAEGSCLGVSNVGFENSISLIPNPTSGDVLINIQGASKNLAISIYNILGAEVKAYNLNDVASSFTQSFDLSNLSSGTYLVKIQSGEKLAVKRLTISK